MNVVLAFVLGMLAAIFLCEDAIIRTSKRADRTLSFLHWGTQYWFTITQIDESEVPKEPKEQ